MFMQWSNRLAGLDGLGASMAVGGAQRRFETDAEDAALGEGAVHARVNSRAPGAFVAVSSSVQRICQAVLVSIGGGGQRDRQQVAE